MRKDTEARVIGTKHFGPKIIITDPCYDADVWWSRIDGFPIKEGDYQCQILYGIKDKRVHEIQIQLIGDESRDSKLENAAIIDVDAGLAGFFNRKDDYPDEEWYAFCDSLADDYSNRVDNAWIREDEMMSGFFSETGYGDGSYLVSCRRNDQNEAVMVSISFIE